MRVLILTPLPSPFVEQPLNDLLREYSELTIRSVFYGDASHRPTWGKLSWKGEWLKGSIFQRLRTLARIVNEFNPDQVVLGQYMRGESWWLKRYARRQKVPMHVIFLEPLIPCNSLYYRLKLAVFKRFLSGLTSVGCMGRRAKADYARVYKGHLYSCPYAFDLSDLRKFDDSERRGDCVTYLYSGRLTAFRDPLLTVRCFSRLIKMTSENVHLIISGTGDLEGKVMAEIRKLHISNNVTWMNDFSDWEDIRNLYRYADVLLSLGVYNTWSLTIQEAMAAGMGVIATQTTEAANELIINDYNGYLVDHDNPQSIVDRMFRYVQSRELINVHGQRNRAIVEIVDYRTVSKRLAKAFSL